MPLAKVDKVDASATRPAWPPPLWRSVTRQSSLRLRSSESHQLGKSRKLKSIGCLTVLLHLISR